MAVFGRTFRHAGRVARHLPRTRQPQKLRNKHLAHAFEQISGLSRRHRPRSCPLRSRPICLRLPAPVSQVCCAAIHGLGPCCKDVVARGRIERPSVVKRGRPLAPAAPYLPNRNCTGAAGRHPGGAAFTGPAYVEKEAGSMPNTGGGSLWIRTRTSGREPPRRTISARLPYSTLPTLRSTPACHPEPKAKDLKHSPPRYTRQNKITIFFTSIGISCCISSCSVLFCKEKPEAKKEKRNAQ